MSTVLRHEGQIKDQSSFHRRDFLKTGAAIGVAAAASPLAAPYISNAEAAAGITLKVQTLWSGGGLCHRIFKTW